MFFTTCGLDWTSSDEYFDYELRGTWETNGISDYSGKLVIDYNTIRISGYGPNTLYELTNGTDRRPFRDFTKDTSLKGYSEEGKLFIYDKGILQAGIYYTYYTGYNVQDKYLEFKFNGRPETLKRTK